MAIDPRTVLRTSLVGVVLVTACKDGGSDAAETSTTGDDVEPLEIIGLWVDDVSGDHDIDEDRWVQAFDPDVYTYFINYYDNDLRFVVARSANVMMYAKFEWIWVGEQLYYCPSVVDQASAVAAEAGPGADGSDPATGGCVGAPWHPLDPR